LIFAHAALGGYAYLSGLKLIIRYSEDISPFRESVAERYLIRPDQIFVTMKIFKNLQLIN